MFRNNRGGGGADYSQVSLEDFSDDDSHSNDGGGDNMIRRQQELMKRQDEGLDHLSATVLRLGEMSMGISDELNQQNKMLESMETELDEAGEDLDMVTRKTKEFIQQAGGTKNCIIIVTLSLIVLILFFVLLYVPV
eukprot:Nitzschia sp. Nitz4//scaffold344_size17659//12296//12867//NITZ4_008812-RA/size17659-snap-gene-0.36-mRNA-1//-1//CDS//3329548615//8314//frame0